MGTTFNFETNDLGRIVVRDGYYCLIPGNNVVITKITRNVKFNPEFDRLNDYTEEISRTPYFEDGEFFITLDLAGSTNAIQNITYRVYGSADWQAADELTVLGNIRWHRIFRIGDQTYFKLESQSADSSYSFILEKRNVFGGKWHRPIYQTRGSAINLDGGILYGYLNSGGRLVAIADKYFISLSPFWKFDSKLVGYTQDAPASNSTLSTFMFQYDSGISFFSEKFRTENDILAKYDWLREYCQNLNGHDFPADIPFTMSSDILLLVDGGSTLESIPGPTESCLSAMAEKHDLSHTGLWVMDDDLHNNYVDCIKYYDDTSLTKTDLPRRTEWKSISTLKISSHTTLNAIWTSANKFLTIHWDPAEDDRPANTVFYSPSSGQNKAYNFLKNSLEERMHGHYYEIVSELGDPAVLKKQLYDMVHAYRGYIMILVHGGNIAAGEGMAIADDSILMDNTFLDYLHSVKIKYTYLFCDSCFGGGIVQTGKQKFGNHNRPVELNYTDHDHSCVAVTIDAANSPGTTLDSRSPLEIFLPFFLREESTYQAVKKFNVMISTLRESSFMIIKRIYQQMYIMFFEKMQDTATSLFKPRFLRVLQEEHDKLMTDLDNLGEELFLDMKKYKETCGGDGYLNIFKLFTSMTGCVLYDDYESKTPLTSHSIRNDFSKFCAQIRSIIFTLAKLDHEFEFKALSELLKQIPNAPSIFYLLTMSGTAPCKNIFGQNATEQKLLEIFYMQIIYCMYIIDKRIIDICQHIELNIDDQLKMLLGSFWLIYDWPTAELLYGNKEILQRPGIPQLV